MVVVVALIMYKLQHTLSSSSLATDGYGEIYASFCCPMCLLVELLAKMSPWLGFGQIMRERLVGDGPATRSSGTRRRSSS